MDELSRLPEVFIRPSPSGSNLGGVARATRESIILCEAAGYDIILVETVGVGQSEVEVKSMVDLFLLLTLPGSGDELQGIKRGIMEMADIIAINKSEDSNKGQAILAQKQLKSAVHYLPPHKFNWVVPVEHISALNSNGIANLYAICKKYQSHLESKNGITLQRQGQNINWFYQSLQHQLHSKILQKPEIKNQVLELTNRIKSNEISPFQAADLIIEKLI
jgi:LAO/AO transport system kinase